MTIETTISINLTREPEGFHKGTNHAFAAYLSIDVTGDSESTQDQDAAKEVIHDFLTTLEKLKFDLYEFSATTIPALAKIDTKAVNSIRDTKKIDSDKVLSWLKKREPDYLSDHADEVEILDDQKISAAQMLRAITNGDAPVPHHMGLVYLVTIGYEFPEGGPGKFLLLPDWLDGKTISDPNEADSGLTITVTDNNGASKKIRTEFLDTSPITDASIREGFLIAEESIDNDRRLSLRIEEQAASLFWVTPHLLDLGLDELNREDIDQSALATVMAASLLDPMLIALMMPGIPEAEGPFLFPIITNLLRRLKSNNPGSNNPYNQAIVNATNSVVLLKVWRELIKNSPLLNTQAKKGDVINELEKLFGNYDDDLFKLIRGNDPSSKPQFNETIIAIMRERMAESQGENGAENLLLKFLEPYARDRFVEAWISKTSNVALDDNEKNKLKELCGSVFSEFRQMLLGTFNGVEAIRRAVGQVYLSYLSRTVISNVEYVNAGNKPIERWKQIEVLIQSSMHFLARVQPVERPNGSHTLDEISNMFWQVEGLILLNPNRNVPDTEPEKKKPDTAKSLNEAVNRVSNDLVRGLGEVSDDQQHKRKFIPDTTPLPLPIRIAPNMDAKAVEEFNDKYGGIGVLIQRGNEGWRHACLTELLLKDNSATIEGYALRSITPVVSDGRGEMFLGFAGFPLSTSAFEGEPKQQHLPLYYSIEATYGVESGAKPVPALRYGDTYQVAAFVTSKSGALPFVLQRNPDAEVWYPKLGLTDINPPTFNEFTYRRRTAIGSIELKEAGTPRLGARYPDVEPLGLDQPRTSLAALSKDRSTAFIDLARNADGSGGINLDNGEIFNLILDGLCSNGLGHFTLSLVDDYAVLASVQVDSAGLDTLHITVKPGVATQATIDNELVVFEIASGTTGAAWLRLMATNGCVLSFNRVETDNFEAQYSSEEQSPLVLLSPKTDSWKSSFSEDFICDVHLSRVGFMDFDYWPREERELENLRQRLLEAYVISASDPNHPAVLKIANELDRLPDPAVGGYLIRATIIDDLGPAFCEEKFIELDKIPDLDNVSSPFSHYSYQKMLGDLVRLTKWQLRVKVDAKLKIDLGENKIAISVPEGRIVKITINALVLESLFSKEKSDRAPIDARMRELCEGICEPNGKSYLVYPGKQFLVETTIDELNGWRPPKTIFGLNSEGLERAYSLVTNMDEINADAVTKKSWRHVAKCDVITQRWQFSGKPIYQWIAPREFAQDNQKMNAAMRLDNSFLNDKNIDMELEKFEQQLFFDRSDSDQHGVPVRINSQKEQLLQRIEWTQSSATYYRHRFTLWSRYRGAMKDGVRSVDSWSSKSETSLTTWTLRAAILADATRVQLTRPQLRALVPLSGNLHEKEEASPPLAAILEEPPFALGGLADRLLAGIQIGAGYGFESTGGAVTPLDLRHEIGPDPRLSQAAMESDAALASTLSVEGPVGLHFEKADSSAPFWANTQYLLTPTLLNSNSYVQQETFLAVRMLRLLDPNWVVTQLATTGLLEPGRAYLADFEQSGSLQYDNNKVVTIVKEEKNWNVWIDRQYIDIAAKTKPLLIAKVDREHISSIQLLHWPITSNSFGVAVLAGIKHPDVDDAIKRGESSVPRLLAVLSWFPRDVKNTLSFENAKGTPVQVSISEVTDQQWARTARNSETTYIEIKGRQDPILVSKLNLFANENSFWFEVPSSKLATQSLGKVMLRAFQPKGDYPQTVHRHLAAIVTHWSSGLGRRFDVFNSAVLIRDDKIPSNNTSFISAVRLLEFQVPARAIAIVGKAPSDLPAEFKNVYLDLRALKTDSLNAYWIRLHVRRQPVALNIKLQLHKNSVPTLTFEIANPIAKANVIDLYLAYKNGSWVLMANDILFSVKNGQQVSPAEITGATLNLSHDGGPNYWGDVSVLPIRNEKNQSSVTALEWDWFFTSKGEREGDISLSLGADKLAGLHEASAQIVSFSPRIVLQNS